MPRCAWHMSIHHLFRYTELFSSISSAFSISNFSRFPCRPYAPSFYWILLCCSAGSALFVVQILVHLGIIFVQRLLFILYFSTPILLFSVSTCITESLSNSNLEIEILVTLYSRKRFNHFILIDRIYSCSTES